ncbi:MAG: SOS response-associated peptidase [Gemmatimonadetes bacterium]|nr:SOS response-associated peptidase [Gemmatimonadota bacterium]
MCGRYSLAASEEELVEAFDIPGLTFDYFARYNIGPGQAAPIVAEDKRGRRMGLVDWGFAPAWMDDPGTGFVNARAESVATKASFRKAFARRRCLVPADGFYEWSSDKTPFWIYPSRAGVLSFAGVWEAWRRPGAEVRYTFAIITTAANADVEDIHDRMPVVVAEPDRDTWLDRASDQKRLSALLRPAPDGTFASHAVSTRVNHTAEDDAGLISSLAPLAPSPTDASP